VLGSARRAGYSAGLRERHAGQVVGANVRAAEVAVEPAGAEVVGGHGTGILCRPSQRVSGAVLGP